MTETLQPGGFALRSLPRRALGVGVVALIGSRARMAAAADAQVTIDNFTFSPTPLTVKPGTTVTWLNRDDIPHSIVLLSLQVHSHALDTGDTFPYRFDQAGTYNYV